jgi:hypothetical protein
VELPPNGQGMAAVEMLNIMGEIPTDPDGPCSQRRRSDARDSIIVKLMPFVQRRDEIDRS